MTQHSRILSGLVLGAAVGIAGNVLLERHPDLETTVSALLTYALEPLGQVFLRMLFMVVIPLVFASMTLGVAELGNLKSVGLLGARTLLYFVATSAIAVTVGLIAVNVIQPGAGLDSGTRDSLLLAYGSTASTNLDTARASFGVQTLINIVPRNPLSAAVNGEMMPVIFFSIMFGIGLTQLRRHTAQTWILLLRGLGDTMVAIINIAMRLAPYGVFALIFTVTVRFGFDIVRQLSTYILVVIAALVIHVSIVYSLIIRFFVGMNPWTFFKKIRVIPLTGFSTSSSSATLPTTMKVCKEELAVPDRVAHFVLPIGATLNMDGTALFEGVTAVFLAQVFGIELSLLGQLTVIWLVVITSIGAAGVPGGSIPLLVFVITSVGVPPEGIAIIIGVDRFLDMCRTAVNVTGDAVRAAFVSKTESAVLPERFQSAP